MMYLADHPELKKRSDSYKDTEYEQSLKELGATPQEIEVDPDASPGPVNDWEDAPID